MKLLVSLSFLLFCISIKVSATYVMPESYGAKGDGITDDTRAFEEAVNTNNDIYLTKTYLIKDITLKKNQKLVGEEGVCVLYNSIVLTDGCVLKNIVLDGQWKTKGVTILGSDVLVIGCSFLNTKNTLSYYGGLTSSLWIGRFQDLGEGLLKCHNVCVKQCLFDGCEPYDTESDIISNRTVARCILSYGCNNLQIIGCIFKNLKGYHDSDFIQIRSYENNSNMFPFYEENSQWNGPLPPFQGFYYKEAQSIIKECVFYQYNCKSSIKVMSSNAFIEKNYFYVNIESSIEKSYSVVRCNNVRNIKVKKNNVVIRKGSINNVFMLRNCLDISIFMNTVECSNNACLSSFLNMTYSDKCYIYNNSFDAVCLDALLNTEYNRTITISKNRFTNRRVNSETIDLFVQQNNHYSYPSILRGITLFKNNQLIIPDTSFSFFNLKNQYDYPIRYLNNTIKTNKLKSAINIK